MVRLAKTPALQAGNPGSKSTGFRALKDERSESSSGSNPGRYTVGPEPMRYRQPTFNRQTAGSNPVGPVCRAVPRGAGTRLLPELCEVRLLGPAWGLHSPTLPPCLRATVAERSNAPACRAGSRRFESDSWLCALGVPAGEGCYPFKVELRGSIPLGSTIGRCCDPRNQLRRTNTR